MKLYGFGSYDWDIPNVDSQTSIYFFSIDPKNTLLPSVTPQILLRPGTYATFGVSQVGAMNIVGKFGWRGYTGSPESAWTFLFTQLNPADARPRELRGVTNAGQLVKVPAILSIPNFATMELVSAKDASFVCTFPFFDTQGTLAGGSGF